MRLLTALSTLTLLVPAASSLASCTGDIGDTGTPAVGGGNVGGGEPVPTCDEEGQVIACWPGDPTTRGIGVCEDGWSTCVEGQWTECTEYVLPSESEDCNDSLDNNCNGVADEGCSCQAGETRACYTGPASTQGLGLCQDGEQVCEGGTWGAECVGEVTPTADEPCDTLDNNCNGVTDDGCSCVDGTNQPCYSGATGTEDVGECHGGQQLCENGEWASICTGEVVPNVENCNNDDDDCDGSTDEGDPGGGVSCTSGEPGVCSAGTRHCVSGSLICEANQNPSSEQCDNLDNDCDGSTDEGDPGGGASCVTGEDGVCSPGTQHCVSGSLVCQRNVNPSTEVCDSQDNDCDGSTDEGDPGGGGSCTTGQSGVCSPGTRHCVSGSLVCQRNVNPSTEVCDNQDNDCDGSTDEGDPGGGSSCVTGQFGVCSPGTRHCVSGSLVCQRNVNPSTEVCDSLDNDCDGSTDENNPCNPGYICSGGNCIWICPYVYGHDGQRYVYETSVGGAGISRRLPDGKYVEQLSRPLAMRLDHARVQHRPADAAGAPEGGTVRAKILAAEDEIVYLRHTRLAVVEHPVGWEVFSSSSADWRKIWSADPGSLLALRTASLRTPMRAVWNDREDVTAALSEKNDRPAAFERTGPNVYELDFGEARHPAAARLVIDGWKFREDRQLKLGYRYRMPELQVQQADGSWRRVRRVPPPRGDRKAVVISLHGIAWPAGRYRMRLHTGTHERGMAMWYLDRVRLSEEPPMDVNVEHHDVQRAELGYSGPPTLLHPDQPSLPRLSEDDGGGRPSPPHQTTGTLTRYGDVTELVAEPDDPLVVMERGDGVELTFGGLSLPAPGTEQSVLLEVELFYKPRLATGVSRDSNAAESITPLPVSPPADGALFDEVAHERFVQRTLTRRPGEGAQSASVRRRRGA